ncbi:hypothetical protein SBA1_550097 [Candidatus Sulfotelmatobacter kueseliae]|uniref:Uncharacterized protein n=1 Tax=Candidatus Sulfotelmatobacter kueseliae TaxID=2042962 RepID=A0A2U3KYM3_9BACT|nr:hypothetical protein SBA1_550097 [Candidatus Sulfotelmatobacter kueseliae]
MDHEPGPDVRSGNRFSDEKVDLKDRAPGLGLTPLARLPAGLKVGSEEQASDPPVTQQRAF